MPAVLVVPPIQRHGYYLKRRHCAYSSTKELAMDTPRNKENPKTKMDVKTEKKKGQVSRSPDDPDHRSDDPAPGPDDSATTPKDTRSFNMKPDHPDSRPDHPATLRCPDQDADIRTP